MTQSVFRASHISTDLNRKAEYRTYAVSINCGGADRTEETRYEIRAFGYRPLSLALKERQIYFLRVYFFPNNTVDTLKDSLYFEGSDHALIGPAETFKGDMINTIGVSSLGIVSKLEEIVEDCVQHLRGKDDVEPLKTIVATVKHTDYHPAANRVSTTSGHRDPSEFADRKVKVEQNVEGSGRPKPKKFVPKSVTAPFKSPVIPPTSTPSLESGPADYPVAPVSPTASDSGCPFGSASVSKKRARTAAPKAKTRVARRTSSNSTLDLTTQE
ncbi:uncharacterized protein MELLADRAFT_68489 [Melampsora larici-populina 98AG31]|uniref:Uncharacterized protein n=1 Tax=Melampsora larici-populina (strain 98AG31 / pathotype 3-4-7) TaxID=747676 RepID=F4S701_MELLP|nr:uncharacterized protein MELLADRAFT_68489 [Melampsora larici-populina 98AG31]EGF99591.1 hypothetical protein MELLADRAFT_68489 [Melampsora larici-populina 98AG31]